ncbi:hypothetical protein [Arenibacterium halophilum]|jgi:hypothetical protein|uniref:Uncharacterized protein n=1 Tax=Arenibacterium halophilum TaxID=2583821 RepID=A0ABY2X683_9RHOB|nr:hypothetical protein [Arenibacterium halophilum]MAY85446.1 hypothetical protein [Pseudooceanicola sp.]TMV10538.1 hypothetical protein FGK64_17300 [Arenibacterium halophilum]
MHRKFIAFIISAAVAVTAFSAPARADEDAARVLAGIAALAILGKIIHDSRDDDNVVTHNRYPGYNYYTPGYRPAPVRPAPVRPVPLPPRVTRYDLPGSCMQTHHVRNDKIRMLGQRCLRNSYRQANALPQACKVQINNRHGSHTGYEPQCLRQRGYRIARN